MKCSEFERWLDAGRPGARAGRMHAHVEECPRCATAMRAADELVKALVRPPRAAAPAGFTVDVMARVREAQARRVAVATIPMLPALAWWVRAAADPLAVLAFGLAAMLVYWRHALWALAGEAAVRLAAFDRVTFSLPGATALSFQLPHSLQVFADPMVVLGLGLATLPAALWLGAVLYRWTERTLGSALLNPVRRRAQAPAAAGLR
jgi:hypothetical protein